MFIYLEDIKKAAKNKVLLYIVSRYFTYFIQFLSSILIAVSLGPYYLGIWGFITLIINYINQINFGVSHSVNAIISIHKDKEWYVQRVIGTSLTMILVLSIFISLFFTANSLFNLNIGNKYNFSLYAPLVVLIGILGYFNSLFSNIFRVYGRITEVAINQSTFPILMFITILLFTGENLLWALIWANFLAFLSSSLLYLIKSPVKIKPIFVWRLLKAIQIKGWHLFIYNTSFYMIIISTRSFISGYYSIAEFGYFTFAFLLANSVKLLLDSFSFLIFPKFLNRLASSTTKKIVSILVMVRETYITTSHLLVHLAIFLFPVLTFFFTQYNQSDQSFRLIALTIVLYTNSFGYSGLLIAKGKERSLGVIAFMALIINIMVALILIEVFLVAFSFVILATLGTYLIYIFLIVRLGRKILKLNSSPIFILKDIYPSRLFIPYLLSLFLIIIKAHDTFFLIPLILMLKMNLKILLNIRQYIKNIMIDPGVINI